MRTLAPRRRYLEHGAVGRLDAVRWLLEQRYRGIDRSAVLAVEGEPDTSSTMMPCPDDRPLFDTFCDQHRENRMPGHRGGWSARHT
jgi:hypothetical protein